MPQRFDQISARDPRVGAKACAKKNLVGNGTTVVKGSAGFLHCVQINTRQASGTITLYDSTSGSGAVLAILDTGLTNASGSSIFYDVTFQNGLTAVIANANSVDMNISYQ